MGTWKSTRLRKAWRGLAEDLNRFKAESNRGGRHRSLFVDVGMEQSCRPAVMVFLRRILEGMGIGVWEFMKFAAAPQTRIRLRFFALILSYGGDQEPVRMAAAHGFRRGGAGAGDFGSIGEGDIVVQSMTRSKGCWLAVTRGCRDRSGLIPTSQGGLVHSQPAGTGESGSGS